MNRLRVFGVDDAGVYHPPDREWWEEHSADLERYREALEKIDAIRNSIVGRQSIHWSMHIYRLVAALKEAGFEGEGYEIARAKAEAEIAALNLLIHRADMVVAEARRVLRTCDAFANNVERSALRDALKAYDEAEPRT